MSLFSCCWYLLFYHKITHNLVLFLKIFLSLSLYHCFSNTTQPKYLSCHSFIPQLIIIHIPFQCSALTFFVLFPYPLFFLLSHLQSSFFTKSFANYHHPSFNIILYICCNPNLNGFLYVVIFFQFLQFYKFLYIFWFKSLLFILELIIYLFISSCFHLQLLFFI